MRVRNRREVSLCYQDLHIDGDLITIIGVSTVEDIYLSATMMITSFDRTISPDTMIIM